jgi:hypothetical protein
MAMSAISSAGSHALGQQVQSLSQHKHGGRHGHSLSDIDAMSSSPASAPSKTGQIGGKLDVTA